MYVSVCIHIKAWPNNKLDYVPVHVDGGKTTYIHVRKKSHKWTIGK